ncbi:MAG TPA: NAD(P)/FAD-dependent oxidoreductase [Vicinamibacterales bacterium]|jgi:NADH dehydrogenase
MAAPHVVILGGGFGGLDAARALNGAPVRVTLIDRHNYHLFQPLLYQVATASLSPGDIASPIRWVLRHQANVTVLLAAVRAIDPVNKKVLLEEVPHDGPAQAGPRDAGAGPRDSIDYDYLIVATGATHAYFGHPEWARRAPGLKTLDDALEIRRQVLLAYEAAEREPDEAAQRRLTTFVIVGGGATGVELAGALAEIARQSLRKDFRNIKPESARILLLEGGPSLLSAFPEKLRDAARRTLEQRGVEVHTGTIVTMVDHEGVLWRAASAPADAAPQRIAAQTVIWAAGVAASPVAKSLGLPLDRAGRVLAEPTLAVPGISGVFVAGDICALEQDGRLLPGVAQVAIQEGKHAARNVLRLLSHQPPQPFRYKDYGSMAVIGRGSAVADIGPLKTSGFFAWLIWAFLHIFTLIGFRNRFVVMGEWAWAYLTLQRRVRLITGERLWPSS